MGMISGKGEGLIPKEDAWAGLLRRAIVLGKA